jgi:hypothetical protein
MVEPIRLFFLIFYADLIGVITIDGFLFGVEFMREVFDIIELFFLWRDALSPLA